MNKRIAICGTRSWRDKVLVFRTVRYIATRNIDAMIVSGAGGNVDLTAEAAADLHELGKIIYPAKWQHYKARGQSRAAGPYRNGDIVEAAHVAIFFWDGHSTGTGGCIKLFDDWRKPYIKVLDTDPAEAAHQKIIAFINEHLPKLEE